MSSVKIMDFQEYPRKTSKAGIALERHSLVTQSNQSCVQARFAFACERVACKTSGGGMPGGGLNRKAVATSIL